MTNTTTIAAQKYLKLFNNYNRLQAFYNTLKQDYAKEKHLLNKLQMILQHGINPNILIDVSKTDITKLNIRQILTNLDTLKELKNVQAL